MRGHLSFLTDGPTDGAKQRERIIKKKIRKGGKRKKRIVLIADYRESTCASLPTKIMRHGLW